MDLIKLTQKVDFTYKRNKLHHWFKDCISNNTK